MAGKKTFKERVKDIAIQEAVFYIRDFYRKHISNLFFKLQEKSFLYIIC